MLRILCFFEERKRLNFNPTNLTGKVLFGLGKRVGTQLYTRFNIQV